MCGHLDAQCNRFPPLPAAQYRQQPEPQSDSFSELISKLLDKSPTVRRDAASALVDLKDLRALDPLISALNDSDFGVKSFAALALGQIKDRRAVDPLTAVLKDANSQARTYAAAALWCGFSDPGGIEPLIAALKDNDLNVSFMAVDALRTYGQAIKPDSGVRTAVEDGFISVDALTMAYITSLGSDIAFYVSGEHPIHRLDEITDDSQFGASEPGTTFTVQNLMTFKRLIGRNPSVRMIHTDDPQNLFKNLQLKLFATSRATPDTFSDGIRVRFTTPRYPE
jgi:hypothetical protein